MRKLATAAAVGLALASTGAKALILGEIEMRSALNQPIDAEIGLSSVAPGELDGMVVKLASSEAFARAGIERSRVLTDLKFDVATGANGQPVILVSSNKPILEPFLNFLVDVDWRGGRLVREYTVLLDPPVFMTPNTGLRDTSTDTPATIPVATEDSILTPLPIDRANGEEVQFDESSVALIGETVEVGDDQVSNVDVDLGGVEVDLESVPLALDSSNVVSSESLGEVVELNDFGEVVELGGLTEVEDAVINDGFDESSVVVIPGAELENGVATLSDPEVANVDNTFTTASLDQESTYDPATGWDVAIVGDEAEVGDDVGASVGLLETVTLLSEGDADTALGTEVELIDESNFAAGSSSGSTVANADVLVQENDTLWEIAEQNKLNGLSTQQMMLALLEANQQAFINGNINLVKAGAVLRIPSENSIAPLSQTQALAEVSSQEQLWRQYRDNLRGVQSNRTAVATAPEPSETTPVEVEETTTTSAAAQQILDEAREELRRRLEADAENNADELKIVADNTSTSTVASATADESDTPDTDKLGSINRKLQLAREELAAARLESEELASQSTELDSVTSNMDQLVTMQQDKLAKLQAQLAEAQENEKLAAEQALAEQKESVEAAVSETLADAGDAAQTSIDGVVEGASDAAGTAAASVGDAATELVELTDVTDDGASDVALAADPTAESVELASLDDQEPVAAQGETLAATTIQPQRQGPWYESLMTRNGAIIGGAAGLGLAGLFLLLRRRKQSDDDELLDHVEFIDDEDDMHAAPVAAATATEEQFTADAGDMTGENVSLDESMADMSASTAAKVGGAAAAATALGADSTVNIDELPAGGGNADLGPDDTASNDDTISEAEVYLAYGLHGQAEDLLSKAVERNPTNPEYRVKLLQTYHAQRNQSAFESLAAEYHRDFGGAASPDWDVISALGQEMNASNELFLSNTDEIESVGKGNFDGPKLDSDDFVGSDETEIVSQVREFSSSEDTETPDLDSALEESNVRVDESDLMDQSLDPGFAFDENDLEATGDFSQIADELNQEKAANESSAPALEDGVIEFDAPELTALDETQMEVDKVSDDSIAQDLSMDLDQLSGDMELDTTELLDGGLDLSQELEMPDLTSNTDLTGDSTASFGDVDEMDTMMDLAKAYIDMGDNDSASSALGEIVKSGNPEQKSEAENLLRKIS